MEGEVRILFERLTVCGNLFVSGIVVFIVSLIVLSVTVAGYVYK